jgi:hypothetical protein
MNFGDKKNAGFKMRPKDRLTDASNQGDFIFNKTPILASALKKLKNRSSSHDNNKFKRNANEAI